MNQFARIAFVIMVLLAANSLHAQGPFTARKNQDKLNNPFGQFGGFGADASEGQEVTFTTEFVVEEGKRSGELSVTAELAEGWHIYSQDQKKGPMPTVLKVADSKQYKLNGRFRPNVAPHIAYDDVFETDVAQFDEQVIWRAPLELAEGVNPQDLKIEIQITGQVCKVSCIPIREKIVAEFKEYVPAGSIKAPSTEVSPTPSSVETSAEKEKRYIVADSPELIAEMATYYRPDEKIKYEKLKAFAKTTLWTALTGAFLGGLILNLMPCVFPVLGLKVMGFVEQAGSEPKKIRLHGLAFTAGLVVCMWGLAGVILFIKLSLGRDVNWGQQMGNPYFVGAIVILLFMLGLNMAGVFEFGTSMTRVGGNLRSKKGYGGSFFSGVLTTLIATPCSGPFLGAAMGYTLAQPVLIALFLFTVFALGIAFPYLLLSFFPALINRLPLPGAWMETFKITMSFALFATAAFFMQTFGSQTGIDGLSWLTMALVVLGLASFFYGHWSKPHLKKTTRWSLGLALPALVAALGLWMAFDAAQHKNVAVSRNESWHPGKPEYYTAKHKRIVWVDYTADW